MYDGEGHRVEQYVSGGSGNHTYYLPGNVEEVTPSGSLVKYYSAGGLVLGVNTTTSASGISYLADDGWAVSPKRSTRRGPRRAASSTAVNATTIRRSAS